MGLLPPGRIPSQMLEPPQFFHREVAVAVFRALSEYLSSSASLMPSSATDLILDSCIHDLILSVTTLMCDDRLRLEHKSTGNLRASRSLFNTSDICSTDPPVYFNIHFTFPSINDPAILELVGLGLPFTRSLEGASHSFLAEDHNVRLRVADSHPDSITNHPSASWKSQADQVTKTASSAKSRETILRS